MLGIRISETSGCVTPLGKRTRYISTLLVSLARVQERGLLQPSEAEAAAAAGRRPILRHGACCLIDAKNI